MAKAFKLVSEYGKATDEKYYYKIHVKNVEETENLMQSLTQGPFDTEEKCIIEMGITFNFIERSLKGTCNIIFEDKRCNYH